MGCTGFSCFHAHAFFFISNYIFLCVFMWEDHFLPFPSPPCLFLAMERIRVHLLQPTLSGFSFHLLIHKVLKQTTLMKNLVIFTAYDKWCSVYEALSMNYMPMMNWWGATIVSVHYAKRYRRYREGFRPCVIGSASSDLKSVPHINFGHSTQSLTPVCQSAVQWVSRYVHLTSHCMLATE